jgi:uncharacterized protein YqhQ
MMVGPKAVAVAVRQPDGRITTAVEPFTMPGRWAKDIPFVRGLVAFAGMLKLARRADDRMVIPIETVAGVALPFIAFGVGGQLPGVRDLWRYHGAEHKAVNTAEAGLELTPQNADGMSRVHPRCGTVMAFWGLLGGAFARSYVNSMPAGRRKAIAGALAGPVVLSTAYEAVRLGWALRNNPIGRALFTPAWQTQRLTTLEPSEAELEVAVAALQAVIDYERAHA